MSSELAGALDLGTELYWEPLRLESPGPWVGHIPFAFWLTKVAPPTILVELGTHSGNSYFAFCQGIAAHGGAGRAYAVDTWLGDEHAGFYGEEVFADVRAFNEAQFSGFSTLLRARFEDARPYFAAGSVDMLHIDGQHNYEAVRQDYETWGESLSERGVVIIPRHKRS